jgi:hypothetical protein
MTYQTLEGILHPNGTVTLPPSQLPSRSVRVMVTVMESEGDDRLSEMGDYAERLADYEERLARGEIRWQ